MPRQITVIQLLTVEKDELEQTCYYPVADAPEFGTLADARAWVKANRKEPCTYYPVRVGEPIKVTVETVVKVTG